MTQELIELEEGQTWWFKRGNQKPSFRRITKLKYWFHGGIDVYYDTPSGPGAHSPAKESVFRAWITRQGATLNQEDWA